MGTRTKTQTRTVIGPDKSKNKDPNSDYKKGPDKDKNKNPNKDYKRTAKDKNRNPNKDYKNTRARTKTQKRTQC